MANLAIIPARGGSKRIPNKNILEFCGQPIIKYSIDAAKKSKCFDEVMVSTDDQKIADIAKSLGADIPFLRSCENSSDKSILVDAVLEVLEEYEKQGKSFDLVCVILPTAPLIKSDTLKKAFEMIEDEGIDEVMPVVAFSFPIQRAFKIEKEKLEMFYPEFMNKNSQDLEGSYHDAGQFYLIKTDALKQQKKMFLNKISAIILPESEVQDIDVLEDLKIAELKYKLLDDLNEG